MKLTKFSLMNPNEVDKYEELQRTKFRPNSFEQAKLTAKTLKEGIERKVKKLGKEEKAMLIRLENLIKGNSAFDGFTEVDYLSSIETDGPASRIAIARLMKDTNKGISDIDSQIEFPFEDGSKPTEKFAKLRLIEEFNLDPKLFLLLPDTGPDALFIDEKTCRISTPKEMGYKNNRSVDAITELKNVVIVWCMKYKGGTAAVGGSGQTDQGTTEGKHFSELFEAQHQKGKEITYKDKPVFFANLVYGAQFNDQKRIVGNELAFKLDYDCKRSFNISLDRVKDIIDFFGSKAFKLDTAVDMLYNKYAYDIEFTGKPKDQEKKRLSKWITN
jgi:hypothetical protein